MEAILKMLIEDNLRSTKLVDALNGIQLYAGEYYTQHHIHILEHHLGIELNEDERDQYYKLSEKVSYIPIENFEAIGRLTEEIYSYLIELPHK